MFSNYVQLPETNWTMTPMFQQKKTGLQGGNTWKINIVQPFKKQEKWSLRFKVYIVFNHWVLV
jgi:hypothetical protein